MFGMLAITGRNVLLQLLNVTGTFLVLFLYHHTFVCQAGKQSGFFHPVKDRRNLPLMQALSELS